MSIESRRGELKSTDIYRDGKWMGHIATVPNGSIPEDEYNDFINDKILTNYAPPKKESLPEKKSFIDKICSLLKLK